MERPHGTLRGFSGSPLEVLRDGGITCVRKRASDPARNARLRHERAKFEALDRIGRASGLFGVPRLLGAGLTPDGRAYYDMEYVVGRSLENAVDDLTPAELDACADRLVAIVLDFAHRRAAAHLDSGSGEALCGKIVELVALLRELASSIAPDVIALLELLAEDVRTSAWRNVLDRPTVCHGDLALDNVLLARDGRLVLIDPLRNPIECWHWDAAKLYQSTLAHWSQIKAGNFILAGADETRLIVSGSPRLRLLHERIAAGLLRHLSMEHVPAFFALTLLRVVPYLRDLRRQQALLIVARRALEQSLAREELRHGSARAVCW